MTHHEAVELSSRRVVGIRGAWREGHGPRLGPARRKTGTTETSTRWTLIRHFMIRVSAAKRTQCGTFIRLAVRRDPDESEGLS